MTPMGGVTPLPPPPTMHHVRMFDANRAGPGSRSNQRQVTCTLREEVRCLVQGPMGGKSRRTRTPRDGSRRRRQDHLHTDRTVPPQLLDELHCTNEALAPTSDCRRRLAWLSTTTSPRLGSPLSVVAVALHPPLLHRFPSKSHLVGSSYYQVFYTGNSVSLTTTRLWRLHCTAQAHHGHTQTRVDLRVAPLLL
jgi:hypothetical protein